MRVWAWVRLIGAGGRYNACGWALPHCVGVHGQAVQGVSTHRLSERKGSGVRFDFVDGPTNSVGFALLPKERSPALAPGP